MLVQKPNLVNEKIIFWCDTKCLRLAQNVHQFLVRPKQFGTALIILGPVQGQGISLQNMP